MLVFPEMADPVVRLRGQVVQRPKEQVGLACCVLLAFCHGTQMRISIMADEVSVRVLRN